MTACFLNDICEFAFTFIKYTRVIIYNVHIIKPTVHCRKYTLFRRCSCQMCSHETLISAREFRCCKEVAFAHGKLIFDGSIEQFSCITQHLDYLALTNQAVLTQVAPLLKDKGGKSYRRKNGSAENE